MDGLTELDWTQNLAEQLDSHWRSNLRPRFDGLTDEEYHWEPVPGMWGIRPRGNSTALITAGTGDFTADFAFPEPSPPPVTTIAWRIAHLVVGCFAARAASHFGGPAVSYETYDYPGDAATALARLDDSYTLWMNGVRGLSGDDLRRPCGPAEGPWGEYPMADLVLHINREALHHGAEIALLRDLYSWKVA
ncbi:MAG TPA: DinB family protein [Trebonia sp.]